MGQDQDGEAFAALVAQTTAVLLPRGLEVEPFAVRSATAAAVSRIAARTGLDLDEALVVVSAESVAELIATAADPSPEGAESVHAVRPVSGSTTGKSLRESRSWAVWRWLLPRRASRPSSTETRARRHN
ncbi:hypothetical protein [Streptomyces specialis]|uniref:hypothetical protein n=1 Tax=Streptomyces specialis TaxID=498367 RepID=UPI00073F8C4E|nr:hypothetical protein [Streptomyces specialis]